MKRRGRIQNRTILLLILLGATIFLATSAVGYMQFTNSITKIYYEEAYRIAHDLKDNIDPSALKAAFDEIEQGVRNDNLSQVEERIHNTAEYKTVNRSLTGLWESFDCSYISIMRPANELDYDLIEQKLLGDKELPEEVENQQKFYFLVYDQKFPDENGDEPSDLYEKYVTVILSDKLEEEIKQLNQPENVDHIEENGDYDSGLHTMAIIEKITDVDDNAIGYIFVELPITVLNEPRFQFIILIALSSIIIITISIALYFFWSRKSVVKPLEIIESETSHFLENNRQISTKLQDIKTNNEIETLAGSIIKLETDLNNYIEENARNAAEKERIQAELDLANHIQKTMLPQTFPAFPERDEFDIYALMEPAKEVGGDFYDFFLIDEDHLCFLAGDVSGKGVPAALFMANAKTLINAMAIPGLSADEIYQKVNDYLARNNGGELFITSWIGIYEISTGKLSFVNAGHEAPVIFSEDGSFRDLETKPNLALAIFDGINYRLNEAKLKPGDKLFIITDGVTDAMNENEEFFTKARFIESLAKVYDQPITDIIRQAKADIDQYIGAAEQFDDITIIGISVNKIEGNKNE